MRHETISLIAVAASSSSRPAIINHGHDQVDADLLLTSLHKVRRVDLDCLDEFGTCLFFQASQDEVKQVKAVRDHGWYTWQWAGHRVGLSRVSEFVLRKNRSMRED